MHLLRIKRIDDYEYYVIMRNRISIKGYALINLSHSYIYPAIFENIEEVYEHLNELQRTSEIISYDIINRDFNFDEVINIFYGYRG